MKRDEAALDAAHDIIPITRDPSLEARSYRLVRLLIPDRWALGAATEKTEYEEREGEEL